MAYSTNSVATNSSADISANKALDMLLETQASDEEGLVTVV